MQVKDFLQVLIVLFVGMYVSLAVDSNDVLTQVFSLWYVRLLSLIVLVYISIKDVRTAIILSILFVTVMNYVNNGKFSLEGYGNHQHGGFVHSGLEGSPCINRTETDNTYGQKKCLLNSDCNPGTGCDVSGFCLSGIPGGDLIPQDTRKPFRPSH